MHRSADRGAAAVELALVLPVLLTLVLGIVDFGFAFNAKIAVTQAAREGARVVAVDPAATSGEVSSRVTDALTNNGQALDVQTRVVTGCSASGATSATVEVRATVATILPIPDIQVTARGVMQCEG
jgi:Flp pilus assembly protein TadG